MYGRGGTSLLSELTAEQLQAEMDKLRDQGQAAFNEQRWSVYEVCMKKWYLAKSYLIRDTFHVEIGRTYAIEDDHHADTLTITKTKGVMAWGIRSSTGLEAAVPTAMLRDAPLNSDADHRGVFPRIDSPN